MTKPELIKLVEEIEDLVCNKMQIWEYEEVMPRIAKELSNRYVEPELDFKYERG